MSLHEDCSVLAKGERSAVSPHEGLFNVRSRVIKRDFLSELTLHPRFIVPSKTRLEGSDLNTSTYI